MADDTGQLSYSEFDDLRDRVIVPEFEELDPGDMVSLERVRRIISRLKSESLNDSLRNLDVADDFYYPGYYSKTFVAKPFDSVHRLLSNRRVIKIYRELEELDEETQASVLEAQITAYLGQYAKLLERCEAFAGDKAFDDGKFITALWDENEIKPVIDIRNLWQDGEETKLLRGTRNVVYDYKGTVYCHCPKTGERRAMAYGGFEKERQTLKYRCGARHYGLDCAGRSRCLVGKSVRISLSEDRRIFTPLARSSYAWEKVYKKRTAAERVNSRLDVSFGFERHFIRGLKKMKLRMGLALVVMLAMALGRIKEKRKELMRSLVRAA